MASKTNYNSDRDNFYDGGDVALRFMEIGVCIDRIDRMNPGKRRFVIPVLTPGMKDTEEQVEKVVQSSKTHIMSDNAGSVDVSNFELSNYIEIEIPKELVCIPGAVYNVEGILSIKGTGSINITPATIDGWGHVNHPPEPRDYVHVVGYVQGPFSVYQHHNRVVGTLKTELNEANRYIEKNSKWLICFIGGDSSMPCVVCRLPDTIRNSEDPVEDYDRMSLAVQDDLEEGQASYDKTTNDSASGVS